MGRSLSTVLSNGLADGEKSALEKCVVCKNGGRNETPPATSGSEKGKNRTDVKHKQWDYTSIYSTLSGMSWGMLNAPLDVL